MAETICGMVKDSYYLFYSWNMSHIREFGMIALLDTESNIQLSGVEPIYHLYYCG